MSRDTAGLRERRRQEAARWFVTLQHIELSLRVLKSWKKWESVPENREAFDAVQRVWQLADAVPKLHAASAQECAADHYDGSVPVSSWRSARGAAAKTFPARRRFAMNILGLAAAAAAVVFALLWRFDAPRVLSHGMALETGIAEHKEIVLEDGTRIHLGAQTLVTVNFTKHARSVVLDRGEALFKVVRDPTRPLQVSAGGGLITVVGTEFNVLHRQDNDVIVTVAEGIVEVTPSAAASVRHDRQPEREQSSSTRRLVRGQEVTYDKRGRISPIRAADLDVSAAWRDGRLKYRSEPLRNVIQDVNRYSNRHVTLGDPAAERFLYSGTVFARDIDDWIVGLERIYPEIEVAPTDGQHVLIRTRAVQP